MSATNFIESKGYILEPEERLDPPRTALLVVDVQNDFCHPDGVFGRTGHDTSMMPKMVANLQELVAAARGRKISHHLDSRNV